MIRTLKNQNLSSFNSAILCNHLRLLYFTFFNAKSLKTSENFALQHTVCTRHILSAQEPHMQFYAISKRKSHSTLSLCLCLSLTHDYNLWIFKEEN